MLTLRNFAFDRQSGSRAHNDESDKGFLEVRHVRRRGCFETNRIVDQNRKEWKCRLFRKPISKSEASSTSRRTYSDSSDEVEQEPVLQGRTEREYEGERGGKRIIPSTLKASSCSYTPLSPTKTIFLDIFQLNIGAFRPGERIP